MKKTILSIALFGALLFTANTVSAKGVILYSNGEKIEVKEELPDTAILDNHHVNLGVMYEQFSIFWIPIWNYGEIKYVLINDNKDTYYDLETEDLEDIKTMFEVDIPEKASIGFWNKIGGKLVWIVVILIFFVGVPFKKRNNANDPEADAETETETEMQE